MAGAATPRTRAAASKRNASQSPSASRASRSKKPTLGFEDIDMGEEELEELTAGLVEDAENAEIVESGEWSPRTKRAGGYGDPEVCAPCALKGVPCRFSEDNRKKGARRSACDHCAAAACACFKAPRSTFKVLTVYKSIQPVARQTRLVDTVKPIKKLLEKRVGLPQNPALASYPRSARGGVSGYDLEWSDYEDEVVELSSRPRPEVKFARRSALALEEMLYQQKAMVQYISLLTHRFVEFEGVVRDKLELPPAEKSPQDIWTALAGDMEELRLKEKEFYNDQDNEVV